MRFGLLADKRFLEHDTGTHPENAARLTAVLDGLERAGLLARTTPIASRMASDEELLRCHESRVIERLEHLAAAGGGWLDPDTLVSPATAEVARLAAGSAIEAARSVAGGDLERAFVCLRPPGHHATPERAMGFCFYSNLALAARACLQEGLAQRIFIFDWDVHHGNGTQDCLYADPNTCFFSMHQSPFYPGTGHLDERGAGPGDGLTHNLPMPAGMGDAEYLYAFDRLVVPVMRRFDPDLVLVSAGYDAHRDDPIGGMGITTEGFARLANRLLLACLDTSAAGRLVGVLEGGYNPERLAESVVATVETWLSAGQVAPSEQPAVDSTCRQLVAAAAERFGV